MVITTDSPLRPECRSDPECPSKQVCINNLCQDPCASDPCGKDQLCSIIDSSPLRTIICQCPSDSFLDQNSRCIQAVVTDQSLVAGCTTDDMCPSNQACRNGLCENPCDCGPNADCRIVQHRPVCTCREGFTGDPSAICYQAGCTVDEECPGTHACVNGNCEPVCTFTTCLSGAVCKGVLHKPVCDCPPGMRGNPATGCIAIGCANDNECLPEQACFNTICTPACSIPDICDPSQECKPFNHTAECICPPGFEGTTGTACTRVDITIGCRTDSECPSLEACINAQCQEPCAILDPCAPTAECEVKPTNPLRTLVCTCRPGTVGYALEECVIAVVPVVEEDCQVEKGFVKVNGTCLCDPLRGLVMAPNGTCICDPDKGYIVGPSGICISKPIPPECVTNDDCPDDKYCNSTCIPACAELVCHPNSECIANEHQAQCLCIPGYEFKDKETGCISRPPPFRTDFPRPDIVVNCLADGVQVDIHLGNAGFDGVLYVKGHSKDESCRRILQAGRDVGSIDYKVSVALSMTPMIMKLTFESNLYNQYYNVSNYKSYAIRKKSHQNMIMKETI